MNDVRTNEPSRRGTGPEVINPCPNRNNRTTKSSTGRPSQRLTHHSDVKAPNVPTQLCTSLFGRNILYQLRFSRMAWSSLPVTMNDKNPMPSSAASNITSNPAVNLACSPRRKASRRDGCFGPFPFAFFSLGAVVFFSLPILN